ncbi:hypothetical protein GOODEAATRI_023892 [Goodea atripinnis]|uniref:Uncharacterized protein n=1 Tax=Goodea atripinnis TaxID=208336 RepID=A0ABV0ND66_9TELE
MHQPKTPATYPPGPKTPKAQPGPQPGGQYAPGTPSPLAHPRPTQEQHSHQASDLCPSAQAPRKHRMQLPDVSPRATKAPPGRDHSPQRQVQAFLAIIGDCNIQRQLNKYIVNNY